MSYELTDVQRERIIAGAALLDEQRPEWAGEINLARLDISSFKFCVLGQQFGDFWNGRRQLFPDEGNVSAIRFGFYPDEDEMDRSLESPEAAEEISEARTSYWRTLIMNRLS